jgi:hypothetical protein
MDAHTANEAPHNLTCLLALHLSSLQEKRRGGRVKFALLFLNLCESSHAERTLFRIFNKDSILFQR